MTLTVLILVAGLIKMYGKLCSCSAGRVLSVSH